MLETSSLAMKATFQRVEKKFWMTQSQYEAVSAAIEQHMKPDAHGSSTVCNIYYDTPTFDLIRRSIERPYFKEKLRIRSYGIPSEERDVFVELKYKLDGVGYKRRICIPLKEAKKLLAGQPISSTSQIHREIASFVERYHPVPKVLLMYQRTAWYGDNDSNFRITIDKDLRYRLEKVETISEDHMSPIMEDGYDYLLEVKSIVGLPPWLLSVLEQNQIYQAPFSKVGACFMKHIASTFSI